jgi:hypothetical protein
MADHLLTGPVTLPTLPVKQAPGSSSGALRRAIATRLASLSLVVAILSIGAAEALPTGNLLANGSGQSPMPNSWSVIAAGGNGWGYSAGGGFDQTPGFFITSYAWCRRSQTIDLIAAGATADELDKQPLIRVGEAVSSYAGNGGGNDRYYIRVELLNAARQVIVAWNAGTFAAPLTATAAWVEHQHEFENYGPGVRFIRFEDGGIDTGYWGGHYGSYHDAARVEFFGDGDGDGMPDEWERKFGTNPLVADADADPDKDFLTNIGEYRAGTDPLKPDTDGDRLLDGDESNTGFWISETNTGTDPLNPDSDSDGLSDGVENPNLPYLNAAQPGTDPNLADTDRDGYSDYAEILAGSDPKDINSIPVFTYTRVMAENFDNTSVNSTYHFTTSSGNHVAGVAASGTANGNVARLTSELHGSSSTSIAWNQVGANATSVKLEFDFKMSADGGGEAADGFGIGFFKTSVHGATGPANPGVGAEWETPGAGNGMPGAVHIGFDIYGGTEGNNIRISGPANPKVVLRNFFVPRQLNSNLFHRAIITAVASGSSTLFNVDLIMDVNGAAEPIEAARGVIIPGFNLMTEEFRIIAGGRTGGVTVRGEIDNVVLSSTGAVPTPEPITITSVTRQAGSIVITWKSKVGKQYIISRSDNLVLWSDIATPVPSAGTSTTYQELMASPPAARYFRIREAP